MKENAENNILSDINKLLADNISQDEREITFNPKVMRFLFANPTFM